MAPYNILSIGSHPNIAFYNWRLTCSKIVNLKTISSTTIHDSSILESSISNPTFVNYNWNSDQFGNSRYTLDFVYSSIEDYISLNLTNNNNNNNDPLDFIILSATSLQELSTICLNLNPIIKNQLDNHNIPTILIESTNFVNLEPFVNMSLQLDNNNNNNNNNQIIPILSIMSDFDIREIGNNNYLIYKSKKESELIYIGKSGKENNYSSQEINLINKISDLFENSNIDVYKLNTPLEFLSYQWKFALPKITVEPLSIIFEKPFPNDLQKQILAKPLISGLIFEIITVIKTMGCKLFNSYDNEDSLLERLSQLYPSINLSDDVSEAPKLYYDFFNQNQLYLDLLLLQPILIADDYQVKTPYLEFLYAVMSQYNSNNFSNLKNSNSIFWLRKNSENIRQLKLQQDEIAIQNSIKEKELNKLQDSLISNNIPSGGNIKQSNNNNNNNYNYNYNQINRSSTDPQIDPEMQELSDMVNNYNIVEKTPPGIGREFNNNNNNPKTPNGSNINNNLQPAFPVNNLPGNSSPNFIPQQNLPHGLPPQGLPPNQQIFNSPQQQQQQQQQQPPIQQSRRSYYNGPNQQNRPPPNQYQNNNNNNNNNNNYPIYPPNQNGNFPPPPMNSFNSRDDVSFMSGRGNYMGNPNMNMNNGGIPNYDTSYGSMNSMNGGPNRQFKPTSRKSSRKSTAVLTNTLVGTYGNETVGGSRGGMPTRHSMAPQPSNPNLRNNSNPNFKKPGIQQSSSQLGLDNSFQQPGGFNNSNSNNPEGLTNGSSGSLPAAMSSTTNLVSVPEATPSPTPAYIPVQDKNDTKKKKKRGFLGLGKKKNDD
jgi:hypothetical protein